MDENASNWLIKDEVVSKCGKLFTEYNYELIKNKQHIDMKLY